MSTNSNGSRVAMKASKMSMADVAAALRRQAGRPVEDHTGLKGDFDFQIEWSPEETPDSTNPSLFTVLKEQLGLKLRAAKGTTEMLVIDQIARPSDN
ncbi:TIGR03435 family protein [Granulicella sibirica]|uniref:CHP03435 domain-containing protein n=1 Tax=Granulicella sibirica TaxID=2479048 RepID=A0A4Q0T5S4_9BACT|nr:TIGR03435 family protein [Granulicella sibirica]RXH58332.1 CHP03435 domain-containing protein [Granulicella sibirica]